MSTNKRLIVAQNKRARHDYQIIDSIEAGIMLVGTEVKSLRLGKASIQEAYATAEGNEIFLINANIPEYLYGNQFNHEPKRPRKLLLHKKEVRRLIGEITRKGITLIPLAIYFNEKGKAKVEIGLAKGRKKEDMREAEKAKEWRRQKANIMRDV